MITFGKLVLAGGLAAALGGVAAPAQAHVGTGGAIIAGLAGLGIGAAIASDHPHGRYYAYDAPPPPPPPAYGYAPAGNYGYAPPPPPEPAAYGYAPPPAYGYEPVHQCRVRPQWDGWQGRYVPVRHGW